MVQTVNKKNNNKTTTTTTTKLSNKNIMLISNHINNPTIYMTLKQYDRPISPKIITI
jgi:hypothetical protein